MRKAAGGSRLEGIGAASRGLEFPGPSRVVSRGVLAALACGPGRKRDPGTPGDKRAGLTRHGVCHLLAGLFTLPAPAGRQQWPAHRVLCTRPPKASLLRMIKSGCPSSGPSGTAASA